MSVMVIEREPIGAGSRMTPRGTLTGADMGRIELVLEAEYRRVLTSRIALAREGMEHAGHDTLLHNLGGTLSRIRSVSQ